MPSTVLIITNELDVHADAVARELHHRGVPVFRFHPEDFPHRCSISIEIRNGDVQGELINEGGRVAFQDICAAWYRQPQRLFPGVNMTSAQLSDYLKAQSTLTLMSLYQCLRTFWVGDQYKLRKANVKALQLVEASKAGLKTPATLISNDPQAVATFIGDLGDTECAVKPLLALGVSGEKGFRLPLTTTLPKGHSLESAAQSPSIFQPYIDKQAELRCVVMGERIFAAKIISQEDDKTRKDWRGGVCKHETYSLPPDIEASIHSMMDSFEINFASLDMILTPEGDHVFLELNPNGQWLWLEEELGIPLVASMADLLMTNYPGK